MRVLRLTLNYAKAIKLIDSNPTSILSDARLWHKNNRKTRVIASDQLKTWYENVEKLSNEKAKTYLLMILYMGYRSNEALTLEWKNVNLKNNTITLPDTKNGTSHILPIPTPLLTHIKTLKKITGKHQWVFTGELEDKPMSTHLCHHCRGRKPTHEHD